MDNGIRYTFSQIRYVVCMYRLSNGGVGVKNAELAAALGYSKPSVHNMLRALGERGIVRQESFGLAFFTETGRALAEKYAACYAYLQKGHTELCGSGAASENALCGLLADMPSEALDRLYFESTR